MTIRSHIRRQLFSDPQVQGALLSRAVLYWFFCLGTVFIALVCWQIVSSPEPKLFMAHLAEAWNNNWQVLAASLLLLPVIAIDCLRVTNQFAGPMLRLRTSMRRLALGEPVEPLHFRDHDYWKDLAESFNMIAAREAANVRVSATESVDEEEPAHAG